MKIHLKQGRVHRKSNSHGAMMADWSWKNFFKRFGLIVTLFFLIKGLLWLLMPLILTWYVSCD